MPSSPQTPHRRRRSSALSLILTPKTQDKVTPLRPSHSRKSSLQSMRSPTTPRPPSSHDRPGDYSFANEFGAVTASGNGLGSLADELAEDWDEYGEGEESLGELQALNEEKEEEEPEKVALPGQDYQHDMGFMGSAMAPALHNKDSIAALPLVLEKVIPSRHRSKPSGYNGSEYDENFDLDEAGGITPSLEVRMATIESLARQGLEHSGSDADGVFKRVGDSLKDLSSQANVESHATRLATAHTAITAHLSHQTRLIVTLTHPLLSPLAPPPDPSAIDPLLPLLSSLILTLPQPPPTPMPSLHALYTSTTDLLGTLSYLSDALHMTRQTTMLASRRLRVAREAVGTMRREMDEAEEGARWLEAGGWDERIRGRAAAGVCAGVVGGFEEVCRGWRARLVQMGGGGVEVGAG